MGLFPPPVSARKKTQSESSEPKFGKTQRATTTVPHHFTFEMDGTGLKGGGVGEGKGGGVGEGKGGGVGEGRGGRG